MDKNTWTTQNLCVLFRKFACPLMKFYLFFKKLLFTGILKCKQNMEPVDLRAKCIKFSDLACLKI